MKTGQWYLWLIVLLPTLFWGEHFEIQEYKIRAHIFSNGTLHMEETIHVLFYEPRHGIYRTIPTHFQNASITHRFRFTGIQVKNFPCKISYEKTLAETERPRNLLQIRIGSPSEYVDGKQVYIISYNVQNPILVFSNEMNEPWQSFYWNLIGTEWDVPIRQVFFEITLDKEWKKPEYSVFVGSVGSTNTKRIETTYDKNSQTIRGRLLGELAPREGITIITTFPLGFWPLNHSFVEKYGFSLFWLFTLLYTISLFLLWTKFGKDKPFPRMVHFHPPHELHPAEAGMLIDNTIDSRDCIATIFKWAGEGYITIEEKQKPFRKDFILHKQKPLNNPKLYETILWEGLFGKTLSEEKNSVSLSELKDVFYTAFYRAKKEISEGVRDKSLYKPYSRELGKLLVFLGFTWIIAGFLGAVFYEKGYFFLMGCILSIVSFFFSLIMPARTEIGQKYYEHLVGFREFMKRAEWPRLEKFLEEDPLYFDKTLPYAIIFGLEKRWINKFSTLLQQSPSWYRGGPPFTPLALSRGIHSAIQSMGTTMSSTPSNSSSSGGGFSGGGGGGGGGGSW